MKSFLKLAKLLTWTPGYCPYKQAYHHVQRYNYYCHIQKKGADYFPFLLPWGLYFECSWDYPASIPGQRAFYPASRGFPGSSGFIWAYPLPQGTLLFGIPVMDAEIKKIRLS